MTKRTGSPWLNYLLGLLCVGAIVAAILLVGPASGSTTAVTRTAKAAEGVVQSTVSGSGNLQPASQLNLGFKTSGTVTKIFVSQGEYVTEGKLIAELNPQSAEVTLEQSKATLLSAEANLAKEEETDGEGATGSANSGASGGATASAASVAHVGSRRSRPTPRRPKTPRLTEPRARRPNRAPQLLRPPPYPAAARRTQTPPTHPQLLPSRHRLPRARHRARLPRKQSTPTTPPKPPHPQASATNRSPATRPRKAAKAWGPRPKPPSVPQRAKRTSPRPEPPSRATS